VRPSLYLSLCALALLLTFTLAGAAFARQQLRPDQPTPVATLRALVDHYRSLTWSYERVAHLKRTPTSYSDRRSKDRAYLQWQIDTWTSRAYRAEHSAVSALRARLRVALPKAPSLHARLYRRVSYTKRLTLRLKRIYPGHVTRSFASARAETDRATLRLWQDRSALAALSVAEHASVEPSIPAYLQQSFMCIHRFEGDWSANTGNGYYGGLQMDLAFQALYGPEFVARWGTADHWPARAQLQAAVRAYQSGRGFGPWPNTARFCGLL
jgi:Transglycosylase-like domain